MRYMIERMVNHSLAHMSRGAESRHHLSREAPHILTDRGERKCEGIWTMKKFNNI